jgi:hypothetical protein
MTILVKDEADIIEANIKTHAKLGVDAFVVMDNNSSDGTREILEKLAREYEITFIDEKGEYNQAKWMLSLAKIAKRKYNANWVISNDADEFWLPRNNKNLKENLDFEGSVLTVERYNMILDESAQKKQDFFASEYYVKNPIFYKNIKKSSQTDISIPLIKIGPKTIVNPKGLLYLRGGNHKALHLKNMRDYFKPGYDKINRYENIEVFHYPIRSYEQFEKNIKNRKRLLESGGKVSMGAHYRRWVKLYTQNKLKEEFEKNILFNAKQIEVLEHFHILQKDSSIKSQIIT